MSGKKLDVKTSVKNFAESSSLHAIKYEFSTKQFLVRHFYLALFFAGFVALLYHEYALFHDVFFKKETTTTSKLKRETSQNFPDLVFCDMNIEHDEIVQFGKNFGNLGNVYAFHNIITGMKDFEFLQSQMRANITRSMEDNPIIEKIWKDVQEKDEADPVFMQTFGYMPTMRETLEKSQRAYEEMGDGRGQGESSLGDEVLAQVQQDVKPELRELIKICQFKGEDCLNKEYWSEIGTMHSICHKFAPPDHVRSVSATHPSLPLLRVLVDHEVPHASPFGYTSVAVQVHFHDRGTPFSSFTSKNMAMFGPGYSIHYKLAKEHYLDKSEYTDCIMENAPGHLRVFPGYFHELCKDECVRRRNVDNCGCVKITHASLANEGTRFCTSNDGLWCGFDEKLVHYECSRECSSQCDYTRFVIEKSMGKFPGPQLENILPQLHAGLSAESMQGNLTQLIINFKSLDTAHTIVERKYDTKTFIAAVGGLFGVFVGASMVTIVEILALLTGFYN